MKADNSKRDRRQPFQDRRVAERRRGGERDHQGADRRRDNRRGPLEYPGF